MLRHIKIVLTSLFLASSPLAQRAPIVGQVVDTQGCPAFAWRVIAIGNTVPMAPEVGRCDQIEATSNDKGRFRLNVLQGVEYDIWAVGPADDKRGLRRTAARLAVGAGSVVRLVEDERQVLETLVLEGTELWPEVGPFRIRLVPEIGSFATIELDLITDHHFSALAVPGTSAYAEVIDKNGQVLWSDGFVTSKQAELSLKLPLARSVKIRVTSADESTPIAGAKIYAQMMGVWLGFRHGRLMDPANPDRWYKVGTTGIDGRTTVNVPVSRRDLTHPKIILLAQANGYAQAHSGFLGGQVFSNGIKDQNARSLDSASFRLKPNQPLSLKLQNASKPLAGQRVLITTRSKIQGIMEPLWISRRFVVTSDGQGRLVLPGFPVDAQLDALWTERSQAILNELRVAEPRGGSISTAATVPLSRFRSPFRKRSGEFDPRDRSEVDTWDLAEGSTVSLQVLARDGGPAKHGRALWFTSRGPNRDPRFPIETALDTVGRTRVRLPAGEHRVIVIADNGYSISRVVVSDVSTELKVILKAFGVMRVKLHPAPEPVTDAWIFVTRDSRIQDSAEPIDLVVDHLIPLLVHRLVNRAEIEADGSADLQFIEPFGIGFRLSVSSHGKSSKPFSLQASRPGDEPYAVELR